MSLLLASTSGGAVTGTATTAQGSQTVDALGTEQFTGTVTIGQGSQSVSAVGSIAFSGTITTGQGSQTVDAVGALSFSGTASIGQGSQTVDAVGSEQFSGVADTGQGGQTVDATGNVVETSTGPNQHLRAMVIEALEREYAHRPQTPEKKGPTSRVVPLEEIFPTLPSEEPVERLLEVANRTDLIQPEIPSWEEPAIPKPRRMRQNRIAAESAALLLLERE